MKISTAKQYRPYWKNIFSQLQNYFDLYGWNNFSQLSIAYWRINVQRLSCHLFLDLLRDLKTFLLSQISQTKTKSVY